VATETLEILEDLPEVDAIFVPIGGGSGAAGACVVAAGSGRSVRVIGVQSEKAPAAHRSWETGRWVEDRNETFAEGLATRTAFELPQRILRDHLAEFVLVSDEEIRRAQVLMIEGTRNLVEAAGAAPLAAILRLREDLRGMRIVLVCSGGNVNTAQLRALLAV
jgi:threonine dehydratase